MNRKTPPETGPGAPGVSSLDTMAGRRLAALDARHLRRRLVISDRSSGVVIERDGRRLVSFSCNDYLNLSRDPEVVAASVAATRRYGTGAGASRLVTGNHPLLGELERRLAALKRTADAVVFGSGYLANLGIIPALVGRRDLILVDELAHACLHGGARLSGATTVRFRHNDMQHLQCLLEQRRNDHAHCLVLTDGVFSMDGDLAPLPELSRLAGEHDAWLLTDDAHGIGVMGGGRGCADAFDVPVTGLPLQMGTLSKAIGAYGGYLCCSHAVAELMRNRAGTLIYTTGLPPGTVAAALAALDVIRDRPAYCARPLEHARLFCRLLDLPPAQSPIVPVLLRDEQRALDASRALERDGFLVTAIRPPTVPRGTARLRLTFCAAHATDDIERLAACLQQHGYLPQTPGG